MSVLRAPLFHARMLGGLGHLWDVRAPWEGLAQGEGRDFGGGSRFWGGSSPLCEGGNDDGEFI
jgi:hypothetical protein